MPNLNSFTSKPPKGGLLRVLKTPCAIAAAFDPKVGPQPLMREYQAIWDTGATNSCVSQKVIDECGLKPSGQVQVFGVHSDQLSDTFLVCIGLPNQMGIPSLRVTKGQLKNVDVLIGMDVITRGDLAVTNLNGNTVFSFCMPPHKCIDFVEEQKAAAQNAQPRPGFRGYTQPRGQKPKHHK